MSGCTRAGLRPRLGKARLGRARPGLRHLARRSTLQGVVGKAQIIELGSVPGFPRIFGLRHDPGIFGLVTAARAAAFRIARGAAAREESFRTFSRRAVLSLSDVSLCVATAMLSAAAVPLLGVPR